MHKSGQLAVNAVFICLTFGNTDHAGNAAFWGRSVAKFMR